MPSDDQCVSDMFLSIRPWCTFRSRQNFFFIKTVKYIFFVLILIDLQEMLGELFTPIETPEAQNRGFLKGFFGGNAHNFDREELCAFVLCIFSLSQYYKVLHSSDHLPKR